MTGGPEKQNLEINSLKKTIIKQQKEVEDLKEQNRILRDAVFGKKSEKLSDTLQDWLFNEAEAYLKDLESEPKKEKEQTAPEKRKKPGRKPLPENLPRIEIIHDLEDDEKICTCGAELSQIGSDITERLEYIPARMQVEQHIRHKYACKTCEGTADESRPAVRSAPLKSLIPGSIATAGLLAHILVSKFCDALPFYRQEKIFARMNVDLKRANMCNWTVKAAEACQGLLNLMENKLLSGEVTGIDETTVQVMNEPGRENTQKSYMWLLRGGPPEEPVLLYKYRETRQAKFLEEMLRNYNGVIVTDGYAGYDRVGKMKGIVHAGCMAHARRKFIDLSKASASPATASFPLERIRQLYGIEKALLEANAGPDKIKKIRRRESRPILKELKIWLDEMAGRAPPRSLLGKAVNYALNEWKKLNRFLDDGNIPIDNNFTENGIRPFVVGRKNWLFAGKPTGAAASAAIYSLIETAKANDLEPYWYLRFIFELLPQLSEGGSLESLLPWNLSMDEIHDFFDHKGIMLSGGSE